MISRDAVPIAHHPRLQKEEGLTADMLRDILSYDPDSGLFRWKTTHTKKGPAGSIAGFVERNGYRRIRIGGKAYFAHRLAWMYVHGEAARFTIDHINQNRDDNRISNLRLATLSQNSGNAKLLTTNTSGYRGVWYRKERRKWVALIVIGGRKVQIGSFETKEQANAAYRAKARLHFGEFFQ